MTRFPSPKHLCSWAGLTPGPPRVRHQSAPPGHHQAGLEAVALVAHRVCGPLPWRRNLVGAFHRIAERRGVNRARVAVARKVLTLAYYGCAAVRSDASHNPRRREIGQRSAGALDYRQDRVRLVYAIGPLSAAANDRIMRLERNEEMPWQPSLPLSRTPR